VLIDCVDKKIAEARGKLETFLIIGASNGDNLPVEDKLYG
jgi:hypothetical protein